MSLANAPSSSGVVAVGLHKSFGAVHAVRGVDLSIPAGQTVALLGPNGAGKSTTIDMLLGLNKPDAGSVSLFGMSPADAVRAGAIGVMLQSGAVIRDVYSLRGLIRPGNSGGPLLSSAGDVVGVVFAASVTDQDTGYALTADQVKTGAAAGLSSSTEVSTGDCAG